MKNIVRYSIQILTGSLFIASGFFKIIDSQAFSSLISSYGFGWAHAVAPIISSIEIILGLCLILNIKPKTTAIIAAFITVLFTIAFAYAFLFRGVEDCGCMGSFLRTSPYVSFFRNMLIILGCVWIWRNLNSKDTAVSNWKKWVVYLLGGVSLCVSGYTLGSSFIENEKIHEGDQLNNTVFRFMDDKISKDTAVVFIFRPNCDHCWNVTEIVKSIKSAPGFQNVIGLTYANEDTSVYMREMKPNFEVIKYPTDELYNFIVGVPVLLVLKDGKVIRRFDGCEIPGGYMLRKALNQK